MAIIRKKCNNKVIFTACGKQLEMRLSDKELDNLRVASRHMGDKDYKAANSGDIYNFAIFALFDYGIKSSSKSGRFYKTFNYHDFDNMYWYLDN